MTLPSANQQKTEPLPPSGASGQDAPVSGDVHGVDVPSPVPAEGTSEESAPVQGVAAAPAIAPEGLADGETDVSMPSTTSF
jgi:hypothetical protein